MLSHVIILLDSAFSCLAFFWFTQKASLWKVFPCVDASWRIHPKCDKNMNSLDRMGGTMLIKLSQTWEDKN